MLHKNTWVVLQNFNKSVAGSISLLKRSSPIKLGLGQEVLILAIVYFCPCCIGFVLEAIYLCRILN